MKRLILNGDFSIWTSKPTSGTYTVPQTGATAGALPDNWYGGAGPGGSYDFSSRALPVGYAGLRDPSRQFAYLKWTSAATQGNQGDYPGTTRSTYLEMNGIGNETPEYAQNEVWTFSFDSWCDGIGPLKVVPIIWLSLPTLNWTSGLAVTANTILTNAANLSLYQATNDGTLGTSAPTHTSGSAANGSVTLAYYGAMKGRQYELYESGPAAHAGVAYVAKGTPNQGAMVSVMPIPQRYSVDIAIPKLGSTNTTDYFDARTLLPPVDYYGVPGGGNTPYVGLGFDLVDLPVVGTGLSLHNIEVNNAGCNRFQRDRKRAGMQLVK